jgi:hypothetical protein
VTRPSASALNLQKENPVQYIQPDLFPISDLQVDGFAEPEPRDTETVINDEPRTEAA